MPMVDPGLDPTLLQYVQNQQTAARQQRAEQIRNLLTTAHAGQTVQELGIDPQQFAEIFGKKVPYDPKKQIVDEKTSDVTDNLMKKWIAGLSPEMATNLAASLIQNRSGVAGFTTSGGVQSQMTTGGTKDKVAADIATATAPTVTQTGITAANTDLTKGKTANVQAGTQFATAQDVNDRVLQGIASMKEAAPSTQKSLNQKLAFGTTESGIANEDFQNQLKNAAIQEALRAQVNPKHPLNAFLAQNGLDIHTAMGATAMGIGNLLDTYAHGRMQLRVGDKEASNIMLRMSTDAAKEMSEKVFFGKVTPAQVFQIMQAQTDGSLETLRKNPKMAGAIQIMDQATEANYQAAVADALQKGDPIAIAAQQAINNMEKLGKEPRQLEAANQVSRLAAARLMTKLQTTVDRPDERTDPQGAKIWDNIYDDNLKRVVSTKADIHWYKPNNFEVTGATTPGAAALTGGQPLPPTSSAGPVLPTAPITGVPALNGMFSAGIDPSKAVPGGAAPMTTPNTSGLSTEQQAAIQAWMKTYNIGSGVPTSP